MNAMFSNGFKCKYVLKYVQICIQFYKWGTSTLIVLKLQNLNMLNDMKNVIFEMMFKCLIKHEGNFDIGVPLLKDEICVSITNYSIIQSYLATLQMLKWLSPCVLSQFQIIFMFLVNQFKSMLTYFNSSNSSLFLC